MMDKSFSAAQDGLVVKASDSRFRGVGGGGGGLIPTGTLKCPWARLIIFHSTD